MLNSRRLPKSPHQNLIILYSVTEAFKPGYILETPGKLLKYTGGICSLSVLKGPSESWALKCFSSWSGDSDMLRSASSLGTDLQSLLEMLGVRSTSESDCFSSAFRKGNMVHAWFIWNSRRGSESSPCSQIQKCFRSERHQHSSGNSKDYKYTHLSWDPVLQPNEFWDEILFFLIPTWGYVFIDLRERRGERDRERERETSMQERALIGCLPYVPWPGTETAS